MNTSPSPFSTGLYRFLEELEANNNRQWFNASKDRYINDVRDPMSRFIMAMQAPLKGISAHVVADPRPVGGSILGSRKGHDRVIRSDGNDGPPGGVPRFIRLVSAGEPRPGIRSFCQRAAREESYGRLRGLLFAGCAKPAVDIQAVSCQPVV